MRRQMALTAFSALAMVVIYLMTIKFTYRERRALQAIGSGVVKKILISNPCLFQEKVVSDQ